MNGLIFGLYGLYAILVATNGNANALQKAIQEDSGGFLPWAISIGVLSVLYDNETTRPVAKPFIYLAILTFILKNFDQIKAQFGELYKMSTNTKTIVETPDATLSVDKNQHADFQAWADGLVTANPYSDDNGR